MRDDFTDAKARGDAVLKTLGDELQAEIFAFLRANTQAKTLEWLQEKHGIEIKSGKTLTDFWQWYPRSRILARANRTASRLEETLPKLASLKIDAAKAREIAAVEFELQAAEDQDAALYDMLSKGEDKREKRQLAREKFEWSKKTDIERALDVLAEELGENDEARRHYEAMKASLAKGGGQ
jgi:hypothetical protein